MIRSIVLDSGPLGLICYPPGFPIGDQCRQWIARHLGDGVRVFVPAIANYELRRELIRLNKTRSISMLDRFICSEGGRYIELSDAQLQLAAELWAETRKRGRPLADPHALDVDVILAAQVRSLVAESHPCVVATTNVSHLSLFVDAKDWRSI
jgi:hypothetical protein